MIVLASLGLRDVKRSFSQGGEVENDLCRLVKCDREKHLFRFSSSSVSISSVGSLKKENSFNVFVVEQHLLFKLLHK